MDPSSMHTTASAEEDEWDTDGFVIPSLGIEDPNQNQTKTDSPIVEKSKLSEVQCRKEENIYLGPHGASPFQAKQQDQKSSSRKQKLKQKLKEADRIHGGTGRENKVDNLRELVGGGKMPLTGSKSSSPRDWLDPHCHESEFERRNLP